MGQVLDIQQENVRGLSVVSKLLRFPRAETQPRGEKNKQIRTEEEGRHFISAQPRQAKYTKESKSLGP